MYTEKYFRNQTEIRLYLPFIRYIYLFYCIYTEKYTFIYKFILVHLSFITYKQRNLFQIFIKSYRNLIVFNIFPCFLEQQTDTVRLLFPDQSENGKYNQISVRFHKILERILRVYVPTYWHGFVSTAAVSERLLRLQIDGTQFGTPPR